MAIRQSCYTASPSFGRSCFIRIAQNAHNATDTAQLLCELNTIKAQFNNSHGYTRN